jgi:predicted HNH restriction endonuclease
MGNGQKRDLRVLCSACHARRHRSGGRLDDLLDRLFG